MPLRVQMDAEYDPIVGAQQAAVAHTIPIMGGLGRRIVSNARGRVKVRSGELRDSIGSSLSTTASSVRLEAFATARHARFVHDGTRPHVIRARNARALRFQVGGRTVFARQVQHPGTKATNFLSAAVSEELARQNLS